MLALEAGNDLLLFANQQAYDDHIVSHVVDVVSQAVATGVDAAAIARSFARVRKTFAGSRLSLAKGRLTDNPAVAEGPPAPRPAGTMAPRWNGDVVAGIAQVRGTGGGSSRLPRPVGEPVADEAAHWRVHQRHRRLALHRRHLRRDLRPDKERDGRGPVRRGPDDPVHPPVDPGRSRCRPVRSQVVLLTSDIVRKRMVVLFFLVGNHAPIP